MNPVSVFVMSSRFGDVKGDQANGKLNPVYRDRLAGILKATAKRKFAFRCLLFAVIALMIHSTIDS